MKKYLVEVTMPDNTIEKLIICAYSAQSAIMRVNKIYFSGLHSKASRI